jgi:hypothetical protein
LVVPPGAGDGVAPLEEAPPVPLGVEPVVLLPEVVPLAPLGGVALLLLLLDGDELDAPPGGVLVLPASAAAPVPLVPAAPGVLLVPAELEELLGLLGLVDGGVEVLALLLGLAAGLLAVPEVSPPPADGDAASFLPHPPNARLATSAPSSNEYFIFI